MLNIAIIPVTPFQQNCSLVWCDQTLQGIVVDPGGDMEHIQAEIAARHLTIQQIVLTHGHIDHVGVAVELSTALDVPIIGPGKADDFWLQALPQQAQMFGCPAVAAFSPARWLAQGDTIVVGNQALAVRHCPGHTPGHIVLVAMAERWIIAADVLFNGSVGRTGFPQGDFDQLAASIRRELYSLPDDFTVYPGHGSTTTIGQEKRHNPLVSA